jgi:catechol 2,3-dioxygenase-like lactoylglutathione lyase family enzyme
MPRIVHIAIKVDDLDKATKFYEGRLRLSPKPAQDMHVGMSQDTSQTDFRFHQPIAGVFH